MDYSIRFWDRIAQRYAKSPVADEQTYQHKLTITRGYLNPQMQVLEFGCGTGSTALALAPEVADYRAIDVSSNMITIANDKLQQQPLDNLHFSRSALEELAVEDGSLDAVLGHSILHLLNDPQDAIARVYRMLKPGGVFVSSTACLADGMSFFRYIEPIGRRLGLMPAVKVFGHSTLEGYLTQAGFEIDYKMVAKPSRYSCFIVAIKPQA